jgi:hypothetical protein
MDEDKKAKFKPSEMCDEEKEQPKSDSIVEIRHTLVVPDSFPVPVDFSDTLDPKKMVRDGPERCPKMIKDTITMLKGLSAEKFSETARYVFRVGFRRMVDLPGMINIVEARQYIYDRAPAGKREFTHYRDMTGFHFFPDDRERLRFGLYEVERAMLSSLSDGVGIYREALYIASFLAGLFDNENIRVHATEIFYKDWCKFADMILEKAFEGQSLVARVKDESLDALSVEKKRRTWDDFLNRRP